jgi:hypothetical protein
MVEKTTWDTFGPDMALSELPSKFQSCLTGPASDSCDILVGNATSGNGYCASDDYKKMTYCACVNNSNLCPQISAISCTNSEFSYKPKFWYDSVGGSPSQNEVCKNASVCINKVSAEGDENKIKDVSQQCNVTNNLGPTKNSNASYAIVIFILVILLILVSSIPTANVISDVNNNSDKTIPAIQ